MLPTEREVLAYDLRQDAAYTRQRLAERNYPDSPTLPGMLNAAHRFSDWCDAANSELLGNPYVDVAEVREAWRREAVASDIRFVPFGDAAALAAVSAGAVALMFTSIGVLVGLWVGGWCVAAVSALLAAAAIAYRRSTPSRLAVGPDAVHSNLAAASARELMQPHSSSREPRRHPTNRKLRTG
ncbi:hypothetical protein JCM12141A_02390 [Mycolicibacterium hodleri]